MRENRPIASDKAKPRMAYEKSCCFKDGFLQIKESDIRWDSIKHGGKVLPRITDNKAAKY